MTASLEIQHLAQEWTEDRDSMSDEAREALFGAVLDIRDCIATKLGDFYASPANLYFFTAHDLTGIGLPMVEAMALCDDAGLEWAALGESQVEP
jgi:hypothetical protein